jgi:hypothetical protein
MDAWQERPRGDRGEMGLTGGRGARDRRRGRLRAAQRGEREVTWVRIQTR